jgi:hypothetical protein
MVSAMRRRRPRSGMRRSGPAGREGDGALGAGADQERDGLRLRQIEPAVQERTPGELAGLGQARAAGDQPARHHPE